MAFKFDFAVDGKIDNRHDTDQSATSCRASGDDDGPACTELQPLDTDVLCTFQVEHISITPDLSLSKVSFASPPKHRHHATAGCPREQRRSHTRSCTPTAAA